MQLPIIGIVLAIGVSLARGGRFRHVQQHDLAWLPALILGLLLQTLLDALAARDAAGEAVTVALLLVSEAAVLGFVVVNWYRPGMWLVGAGFAANAVVILANGGMPVSLDAIQALGGDPSVAADVVVGKHTILTDATALPWLADVLPLPPLNLIVSIGDVVLVAGMVPLAHDLMTPLSRADRLGRPVRHLPRRRRAVPTG